MTGKILELEGVVNFRDYGDYASAAGARIHAGRLYRSAHHGKATDADLEAIGELGIGVVVDLRRPSERRREPSRRPAGFDGQVIESDLGDDEDDAWWARVRDNNTSEAELRGHLTDYYRMAPFDLRLIDLYSRYFVALAQSERPVLIHCAAGKDRTGILAALTHHLIGVHPDDILADYLLTNQAIGIERRLPLMLQAIEKSAGSAPAPEAMRVIMGVDAAYLAAAVSVIEAEHGGLDAYLADVLGVDAALRAKVEARLLG